MKTIWFKKILELRSLKKRTEGSFRFIKVTVLPLPFRAKVAIKDGKY